MVFIAFMAIIRQNIVFSLGIKLVVMLLSVLGLSSMWLAVFAGVGAALLAVLNSMRIMIKRISCQEILFIIGL